jgi:hypothetical protein
MRLSIFIRKYFPMFLCIASVFGLNAQTPYAEFDLESNNIDDIQAFAVGDSVFLTYFDRNVRKTFWIDEMGKKSQVFMNHVTDIRFCGIQKTADSIFYYYLKEGEDKLLRLYALKQASSGGGGVYSGGKAVTLYGDVMGINTDETGLIISSYIKKSNRLELISLKRGARTGFVDLQMPEDFQRFAKSSGFIQAVGLNTVAQGAARTKMYLEGSSVVITVDEDVFGNANGATKIIRIDLETGRHVIRSIPDPNHYRFSSFYNQGKLYQFASSEKVYEWYVYDIETGKTLYQKKLTQDESLRDKMTFHRNAEFPDVWYGSLYALIALHQDLSLTVEMIPNSADVRIVAGTFSNNKGVATAGGMSPLGILVGLVVANVVNQLEPPPGIQNYFYLRGNAEKGFELEPAQGNQTPSVRQIIDQYEISRTSAVPKGQEKWSWYLQDKGYLALDHGAVGIYREKRKSEKKLILLKYGDNGGEF